MLSGPSRNQGIIVLSQFAGAANELTSALIVNPYDRDEVAAALDRALTMSLAERISVMQKCWTLS